MKRMPFPADVNPSPDARYYRQSSEAFLCNATEAQAFHHFPKKKRPGRWLAVIFLTMICIALFGCAKPQPQPQPQPQPMPVSQERTIPKGVCANGDTGIWIDATTITCHKETK